MSIFITIILAILQALPTLLPILIELWNKVRGNPLQAHHVVGVILRHGANPAGAGADVTALHAHYVQGQPLPAHLAPAA